MSELPKSSPNFKREHTCNMPLACTNGCDRAAVVATGLMQIVREWISESFVERVPALDLRDRIAAVLRDEFVDLAGQIVAERTLSD
jgi:hypothetical protein